MSVTVEYTGRGNDDAWWSASKVKEYLGLKSASTFYLLAAQPDFPTKIILGQRCVRWKSSEIVQYAERQRVTRQVAGGAS